MKEHLWRRLVHWVSRAPAADTSNCRPPRYVKGMEKADWTKLRPSNGDACNEAIVAARYEGGVGRPPVPDTSYGSEMDRRMRIALKRLEVGGASLSLAVTSDLVELGFSAGTAWHIVETVLRAQRETP